MFHQNFVLTEKCLDCYHDDGVCMLAMLDDEQMYRVRVTGRLNIRSDASKVLYGRYAMFAIVLNPLDE